MISRDLAGRAAVVIASGPSLTQEDVDFCRGKAFVAVANDGYRMAPWADLIYAADWGWWDCHDGVMGFAGEKWTCDERAAREFGLTLIEVAARGDGFSLDPTRLHRMGGNSGGQLLNLVALRGASPIYMLGYDMQATGGRKHWFGDHPKPINKTQNFTGWRQAMDAGAASLADLGVTAINCSRETALTAYPKSTIQEALSC
jgi:hypothetical protein